VAMKAGRKLLVSLAWLAVPATTANAALDAAMLQRFGGTYQVDCGDPASPKVTIFENDIVVLKGSLRVAAGSAEAQHSYFGNSAPEGYLVAIVGESSAGQMIAIVYQDAKGEYLKIDGDSAVMSKLGAGTNSLTFRRCGATPAPKKPDAQPDAAPARTGVTDDPAFQAAWKRALGPLASETWLLNLDGPSPEPRPVRVAGVEYTLISNCRNHACDDHNVVILWSKAKKAVYGEVHMPGRVTRVGSPPVPVWKELTRQWQAQWRKP
jgi:hypothetical protein